MDVINFDMASLSGVLLCGAFFLCGLIDAICGGGGLITLPTFLSLGFPVHYIMGTTQCTASPGAIVALLRYRKGGKIFWKTALPTALMAMLGSFLGARINIWLPAATLQKIILMILPILIVFTLLQRDFGKENCPETLSRSRTVAVIVVVGLLVGMYQGFYGAGCGLFYLLGFAVLNHLNIVTASGNTKVVMLAAGLTSCMTYILADMVIWRVVMWTALFNMLGNYVGACLAVTKGAAVVRPMFFGVLFLLLLRLLSQLFF